MAARLVNVDRDTLLLLPPNMREWVPEGHLVHFILDAVGELNLSRAKINERGSGSEQYPPSMMLGLLIYSHATGVFGSRQLVPGPGAIEPPPDAPFTERMAHRLTVARMAQEAKN